MTRKRYIKLMMAEGWDRNTANYAAELMREHGISYEEDYAEGNRHFERLFVADTGIDIEALCEMMRNVTDTIQRVGKAMCSAVSAFTKAYTEAMSAEGKEGAG